MLKSSAISKLMLLTALTTSLVGCGKTVTSASLPRTTAAATTSTGTSAMSVTTPAATTPDTTPAATVPATTPTTAATSQLTAATPTAAAPTLSDITATVSTTKNGLFLGLGAFKCTVEVTNPSSVARQGTLTVTFMDGDNPSATPPFVLPLVMKPNETRSYDLSDPKWSTNDVTADVVTKPYADASSSVSNVAAPAAAGATTPAAAASSATTLPTTNY